MTKNTIKRKPSAFNVFMKTEIKKVKQAHPKMTHQQAFKTAAHNWKGSSKSRSVSKDVKHRKTSKSHKSRARKTRKTRKTHHKSKKAGMNKLESMISSGMNKAKNLGSSAMHAL